MEYRAHNQSSSPQVVIASLLIGILLCFASGCLAKPSKTISTAPAAQLTEAQIQAAFEKAATPGENHRVLEPLIGVWDVETKFWASPEAAPQISLGTSRSRWIYGGRFIEEKYSGVWNGAPFEGTSVLGYDTISDMYQSSWIDSMSTQMMLSTGTFDRSKNTIVLSGEMSCPMTGKTKTTRSVTELQGPDRHISRMLESSPDGREFVWLEMTYTRRKEASSQDSGSATADNIGTNKESKL